MNRLLVGHESQAREGNGMATVSLDWGGRSGRCPGVEAASSSRQRRQQMKKLLVVAFPSLALPSALLAQPRQVPQVKAAHIDVNRASADELKKREGVRDARANAIMKSRPYRRKDELMRRTTLAAVARCLNAGSLCKGSSMYCHSNRSRRAGPEATLTLPNHRASCATMAVARKS